MIVCTPHSPFQPAQQSSQVTLDSVCISRRVKEKQKQCPTLYGGDQRWRIYEISGGVSDQNYN